MLVGIGRRVEEARGMVVAHLRFLSEVSSYYSFSFFCQTGFVCLSCLGRVYAVVDVELLKDRGDRASSAEACLKGLFRLDRQARVEYIRIDRQR